MIQVSVYWNGRYQGYFDSSVRLQEKDVINGVLFQNITAGEKFEVIDASALEVILGNQWPNNRGDIKVCQDISVIELYQ